MNLPRALLAQSMSSNMCSSSSKIIVSKTCLSRSDSALPFPHFLISDVRPLTSSTVFSSRFTRLRSSDGATRSSSVSLGSGSSNHKLTERSTRASDHFFVTAPPLRFHGVPIKTDDDRNAAELAEALH